MLENIRWKIGVHLFDLSLTIIGIPRMDRGEIQVVLLNRLRKLEIWKKIK